MIHAPRLEAADVWYSYEGGLPALRGAALTVAPGEFLALVGQNGAGKSTLAKHFNGLLRPERGSVRLDGADAAEIPAGRLARQVGYVFQNPDHQLFSPRVAEDLALGPRYSGLPQVEVEQRVEETLEEFGLQSIKGRGPGTLSFGLRRLVSVAAMAALRPPVFILDEPTSGLDWGNATRLMDRFAALNRNGHSVVLITHDMRLAAGYASRVAVMGQGRVLETGRPEEVFGNRELLRSTRLSPPPVVELVQRLADGGMPIRGTTVSAVCQSILAHRGSRLG